MAGGKDRSAGSLRVGVVGAAGHTGGELCRLLLGHPEVAEIVPTARGGERFERLHGNLAGCGLEFVELPALSKRASELDVVFLCTPSGEAMHLAPGLLEQGTRVIDLSADFRFVDPAAYELAYGQPHACPDLLADAACGITELHRDSIRGARLVANPGCYVIAATLALAPLLTSGLVDLSVTVHVAAVNGTSGAGSNPRREVMHSHAFASMLPYSMDGHRHSPELEARLAEVVGTPVGASISTAHGNFARGIHLHATLTLLPDGHEEMDRDLLVGYYLRRYGRGHEGEHFVIVNAHERRGSLNDKDYDIYPMLGNVIGSNFCHLGVDCEARLGVAKAIAAIDNLVKGAAGSAIQNMNAMLAIDETAGLSHYGL